MPIKKTTTRKVTPKKDALKKLTVPNLRAKAKRAGIKLSKTDGSQKTKAQLVLALDKVPTPRKKATTRRKPATGQTGTSNKRFDMLKRAFKPGRRISKTGRPYTERRANRSDVGLLMGEKYNGWANYWTWRWALEMIDEDALSDAINDFESSYELAQYIKEEAEMYVDESAEGWVKDWMFAVLSEINWREIAENVWQERK